MTTKVILVTGAASGIGLACTRDLLAEGNRVTALDLDMDSLKRAHSDPPAELALFAGDVAVEESCNAAIAATTSQFGALDALIHFAAIHSTKTWEEISADEFNQVLEVNITGAFLIARAAARYMAGVGNGAIVLTSSSSVYVSGIGGGSGRGGPAYVTSKGGVQVLTRALARSLGPLGIRVNSVSPGSTETPMIAEYSEEARQGVRARTPLGRLGDPHEIAAVARYLISDGASYINGETIQVNGGGATV